ncbi:MAG: helix-turn-helix domain-containing protein [Solirubrobacterales bacterium]|nr:helix-turn-helix domain-containing protein [Solirubrobacterales bacterium]
MITNERQYRITKAALKRFEEGLAALKASGPGPDVHPRIHEAMIEANESQRDELREELERYDDLRSGRVAQRTLRSLRELPIALIEARIAARLTQRELANRLGVPEQQVQRWEANSYSGVAIDRLQEIADALPAPGARDGHVRRPDLSRASDRRAAIRGSWSTSAGRRADGRFRGSRRPTRAGPHSRPLRLHARRGTHGRAG